MISYDGLKIDSFLASAKFIGCIYAPYVPFNCILPRELFLNNKCFAVNYQIRYSERITMYTFIYVEFDSDTWRYIFIDIINQMSIQDANYLAVYPSPVKL